MDRLKKLRTEMDKYEIDYYIIPSSDPHQSEYVPDYYNGREFISGFTGSAGTLLVGKEKAFLWTDGRYFIQAETQLQGSGIKLMKMKMPGYETIEEWIKINLKKGKTLAFDGNVISTKDYKKYEKIAEENDFKLKTKRDILIDIWNDRPQMPKGKVFIHELKFAGKSTKEKLSEVREKMQILKGENYILTSLDDIAWLFNIRGNDIAYNPVTLSYALITVDKAILYVDNFKIHEEVSEKLRVEGTIIKEYLDIFKDVKELEDSVIIDSSKVNATIYLSISKRVNIIEHANITTELKAIKNEIEIKNIEAAQVRDGVAMVKFIKWLKENVKGLEITEISAADKLEELRAKGDNFKGLSFNTIAGYKDHAAMMHYAATEESKYTLKPEGMFLVDSGAQYLDGTTDVTRTFILGTLTEEEKRDFTLVLKGHIA
ncbi:MAG TPA: aminopeptidase P family N-terminal domain-containing protein, partial [Clostridium sp.]